MMDVTPQLIEKYHLGRCNAAEREAVERWLADDGMEAFESPRLPNDEDEVGRLWGEMTSRLPLPEQPRRRAAIRPAQRWLAGAMAISAVAAVLLAAVLLWPMAVPEPDQGTAVFSVLDVPKGRKARLTLNDGTAVHLNGGSRLEYPEAFGPGKREVRLVGEAFFAVAHDADRPFVVGAGKTTAEVLGTSFNLSVYPDEAPTLLVEEGTVRFRLTVTDRATVVGAGRGARMMADTTLAPIDRIPADRLAWKADRLVFNGHSLADIATRLERWYDVSVSIQRPELASVTFTGSFDDAPLKTVLDDLAFVLRIRYRMAGKEVVIF